jgi:hypothetical protein
METTREPSPFVPNPRLLLFSMFGEARCSPNRVQHPFYFFPGWESPNRSCVRHFFSSFLLGIIPRCRTEFLVYKSNIPRPPKITHTNRRRITGLGNVRWSYISATDNGIAPSSLQSRDAQMFDTRNHASTLIAAMMASRQRDLGPHFPE